MNLIGTKWKPLILFHLLEGGLRSGILERKFQGFQIKCLLKQ
jgi:DNA-binding HxlR family transcriptional regulator